MFVFLKSADNETSARGLLGADLDPSVQTSSPPFLNKKKRRPKHTTKKSLHSIVHLLLSLNSTLTQLLHLHDSHILLRRLLVLFRRQRRLLVAALSGASFRIDASCRSVLQPLAGASALIPPISSIQTHVILSDYQDFEFLLNS